MAVDVSPAGLDQLPFGGCQQKVFYEFLMGISTDNSMIPKGL